MYFDDLKITHHHSPILQAADYYPFGGTFNSYQRTNSAEQRYLYNGNEEQSELDLYDFNARFFDQALGRFLSIDPLTEVIPNVNPYHFSFNNPVLYKDPTGLMGENPWGRSNPDHIHETMGERFLREHNEQGSSGNEEKEKDKNKKKETKTNCGEKPCEKKKNDEESYGETIEERITNLQLWLDLLMGEGAFAPRPGQINAAVPELATWFTPVGAAKGGQVTYSVYRAVAKDGKLYWGMTRDFVNRVAKHGDRFLEIKEVYTKIPSKSAARGIEQIMIDKHGGVRHLDNAINSISKQNEKLMQYYKDAINYLKSIY